MHRISQFALSFVIQQMCFALYFIKNQLLFALYFIFLYSCQEYNPLEIWHIIRET